MKGVNVSGRSKPQNQIIFNLLYYVRTRIVRLIQKVGKANITVLGMVITFLFNKNGFTAKEERMFNST